MPDKKVPQTIEALIETVTNISLSLPEDYSSRELYNGIENMRDAIIALKELALAQNAIIMELQQKLAQK